MTATAEASRVHIGHGDALTLLYAAVTGERGELGRLVRNLLLLHQVLPGAGQPWSGCERCHGTGLAPAVDGRPARHCCCRCNVCTCNEPLCAGPCDTLAVMLDALVLRGLPAEAMDVPRTLDMLHLAAVRRIVDHAAGDVSAVVTPSDSQPGTAMITIGNLTAAEAVVGALGADGYQCQRRALPGPPDLARMTITYRH